MFSDQRATKFGRKLRAEQAGLALKSIISDPDV